MLKQLGLVLAVAALSGACREADRETGSLDNERSGVDTVVESETIKDTTIVRADTSIDVDTLKHTDNLDDENEERE